MNDHIINREGRSEQEQIVELASRCLALEQRCLPLQKELKDAGRALSLRETRIRELENALRDKDVHIQNIEGLLQSMDNLKDQLAAKDAHISNLEASLSQTRGDLDRVYHSISWRLTKPIRLVSRLVRRRRV